MVMSVGPEEKKCIHINFFLAPWAPDLKACSSSLILSYPFQVLYSRQWVGLPVLFYFVFQCPHLAWLKLSPLHSEHFVISSHTLPWVRFRLPSHIPPCSAVVFAPLPVAMPCRIFCAFSSHECLQPGLVLLASLCPFTTHISYLRSVAASVPLSEWRDLLALSQSASICLSLFSGGHWFQCLVPALAPQGL